MSSSFNEEKVTYFAETDARNRRVPFGIKAKDRTKHVYVIGKTGMGKSTLLENMAVQDIQGGNGIAFIDPHGKTAELLLEYVPEERVKDVMYFAPFDMDHPISFNVMEDVGADKRHLVANGLMSAFKKIWVDAWSARMEYILNNIILALLEYPDSTLLGVNRMLADKNYRNKVVDNITDPSVKSFWTDEFAKYGERYMQEAGAAIQNKIGQFISNPVVRNIIGQPRSTFDFREFMDKGKVLIVNLSKGRVGEANANLLGSMLITKIYLAALSRADIPESTLKGLPNFYLFVDEFQSFANESFADILSEARKYKLNLTIAHQYIEQMSEEVRAAVFGNVGTMISFRVGAFDAETLEKEFAPQFTAEDLVNLGFTQIYLKLMIDGVSSQPFSASTLPPIAKAEQSHKDKIIAYTRTHFAQKREKVEEDIMKWHQEEKAEPNAPFRKPGQGEGRSPYPPKQFPRPEGQRSAPLREGQRPPQSAPFKAPQAPAPRPVESKEKAPHHRQTKHEKQEAQQQRELELRQAISLSSLKATDDGERQKKKELSKENSDALRSALSSVLGSLTITPPAAPAPAPEAPAAPAPAPAPEKAPEPETILVPPAPVTPAPAPAPAAPAPEPAKKEIPEEVLRKTLSLDDN